MIYLLVNYQVNTLFFEKLKSLGYDIEPQNQNLNYLNNSKPFFDKKKSVTDRDIHAIIQGTEHEQNAIYQVDTLQLQFVSNGLQSLCCRYKR